MYVCRNAKKMRLVISPFTDAAMNLALEEVFFKSGNETLCFIYRNTSSVIVGKHQNIFKEVNIPFCLEHNIQFLRRISGGGTVFHDLGNLNISLHDTRNNEFKVDYKPLLQLIKDAVARFGIELSIGDRNDLYLKSMKITGTACHVVRSRTVHHGTLLFNTDKTLLHGSLSQPLKFTGRGVDSVSSKVTNIAEHMEKKRSSEEFFSEFIVSISDILEAYIDYPTDEEVHNAEQLKTDKYRLNSWNLDYSPPFKTELEIDGLTCSVDVEKGKIISISPVQNEKQKDWLNKPFIELLKSEF